MVEGGAAAAEGIECATVMVKDLQCDTQKGRKVREKLSEKRTPSRQPLRTGREIPPQEKTENYNSYYCGGSLLRREGRRVCPWGGGGSYRRKAPRSTCTEAERSKLVAKNNGYCMPTYYSIRAKMCSPIKKQAIKPGYELT